MDVSLSAAERSTAERAGPAAPAAAAQRRPTTGVVSVVVPVKDPRFLGETLASLAGQRAAPEVIVVDDGSDPRTPELVAAAGGVDHYIREPDDGQSDALNKGFAAASGALLTWLNADDLLLPGALAEVVARFDERPQCDVLHGDGIQVDSQRGFLRYYAEAQAVSRESLARCNPVCQPSTFFRRRALDAVDAGGGPLDPDLHYAMDWDLWWRMQEAGLRFEYHPRPLSAYRRHAGAKSVSAGWPRLRELWRVQRSYSRGMPCGAAYHASRALQRLVVDRLMAPTLGDRLSRWLARRWGARLTRHGICTRTGILARQASLHLLDAPAGEIELELRPLRGRPQLQLFEGDALRAELSPTSRSSHRIALHDPATRVVELRQVGDERSQLELVRAASWPAVAAEGSGGAAQLAVGGQPAGGAALPAVAAGAADAALSSGG